MLILQHNGRSIWVCFLHACTRGGLSSLAKKAMHGNPAGGSHNCDTL